jgi:hypothetical protein
MMLDSEEEIEQGRQLSFRLTILRTSIGKLLDQFYEEYNFFKENGSFEIIWDDIIFDLNDR